MKTPSKSKKVATKTDVTDKKDKQIQIAEVSDKDKDKNQIRVALIAAISAIIVALIGVFGLFINKPASSVKETVNEQSIQVAGNKREAIQNAEYKREVVQNQFENQIKATQRILNETDDNKLKKILSDFIVKSEMNKLEHDKTSNIHIESLKKDESYAMTEAKRNDNSLVISRQNQEVAVLIVETMNIDKQKITQKTENYQDSKPQETNQKKAEKIIPPESSEWCRGYENIAKEIKPIEIFNKLDKIGDFTNKENFAKTHEAGQLKHSKLYIPSIIQATVINSK